MAVTSDELHSMWLGLPDLNPDKEYHTVRVDKRRPAGKLASVTQDTFCSVSFPRTRFH